MLEQSHVEYRVRPGVHLGERNSEVWHIMRENKVKDKCNKCRPSKDYGNGVETARLGAESQLVEQVEFEDHG